MKHRFIKYFVVIILFGLFASKPVFSQEFNLKNYRMLYKFSTTKQTDNSRVLEVSFIARNKKDRKDKIPVFDAEINFYNVLDDNELKLGIAKTDHEGTAELILPESQKYLVDNNGYINLKAVFDGTDELDAEEEELALKDLFLEMDLSEVDSVKTVLLKAFTLDSLQTKVPAEEADIVFSVGGMLSKMPIEEATLEDGEYEFEFPENIKGDIEGNVEVFAFIEDHDDFGSVLVKKGANWGTKKEQINSDNNQLWTDIAPIWMYVVLTILLVGVWANYVYSIINLLKIKKEGKELEIKAENKELT